MFLAWDDIREEVLRRIGRRQVNWQDRAEHLTAAAFNFVATEYHHPSLDDHEVGTGGLSMTTGADEATLPTDWQNIMFAKLVIPVTEDLFAYVRKVKIGAIERRRVAANGVPKLYTIFGNDILFDRPVSQSVWVDLRYYTKPTQPDFAAPTNFPLELVWVEPTIIKACELGFLATFRPDLAAQQRDMFEYEVSKIPTALLVRDVIQQLSEEDQDATLGHQGTRA